MKLRQAKGIVYKFEKYGLQTKDLPIALRLIAEVNGESPSTRKREPMQTNPMRKTKTNAKNTRQKSAARKVRQVEKARRAAKRAANPKKKQRGGPK